jgi:hypothetical protein
MGFFEGAQNFEINGGNFIDMRGTQLQYNSNMMSIRGNNNNAQMNPTYNSGDLWWSISYRAWSNVDVF